MKWFLRLIILMIINILPLNANCQTLHFATGELISPKIVDSIKNYKSIPFIFGFDYTLSDKFYVTTNVGYNKQGFKIKETLILNKVYFNTSMDYYFLKDFPVRPFVGLGFFMTYLINSNRDLLSSNLDINLTKFNGGFLIRYGARQKFSKFELSVLMDVNLGLSRQGRYSDKNISDNYGGIWICIGIPLKK